jgi:O-methyltransferase domain
MQQPNSAAKPLITPQEDLALFTDHLSQAWGVGVGFSAAQYVAWSDSAGMLAQMAAHKYLTFEDLCAKTTLNEAGLDSLLHVLMAMGVAERVHDGYRLTTLGAEYFLSDSPYYVGPGLFWGCDKPIPGVYLRMTDSKDSSASVPLALPEPSILLKVQQSRNLAPGVRAVRTGRFEGIRHLVDIGGGAGALAIPFALDYPASRVTLTDLSEKIKGIQGIVGSYGISDQIDLRAMDIFTDGWDFPGCDGMLFGNIFHMFDDTKCRFLAQRCFDCLETKGKVFVHEVLFDEDKAGPMVAALWNATMHFIGGRQRTASELIAILEGSGFGGCELTPTAGRFTLVTAVKGWTSGPATTLNS